MNYILLSGNIALVAKLLLFLDSISINHNRIAVIDVKKIAIILFEKNYTT